MIAQRCLIRFVICVKGGIANTRTSKRQPDSRGGRDKWEAPGSWQLRSSLRSGGNDYGTGHLQPQRPHYTRCGGAVPPARAGRCIEALLQVGDRIEPTEPGTAYAPLSTLASADVQLSEEIIAMASAATLIRQATEQSRCQASLSLRASPSEIRRRANARRTGEGKGQKGAIPNERFVAGGQVQELDHIWPLAQASKRFWIDSDENVL